MATVSVSSTIITNRDASPRVLNNSRISKGSLVSVAATAEVAATDNIGSIYKLVSIPSNARVGQLLLSCDSLGTAGAANVGIYQTTENGSAVVDVDFFALTQSLTTALKNSDITFQANGAGASNDVAKIEMPLWQAMGLTADTKRDYDICATLTTAPISAGTLSIQCSYAI